ncbi:hypothetical protein [Psychrosphaera algicola]
MMCAVLLSFKSYAVTKVTIGIIPGAIDVNSKLSNDYMNFIRQLEDSTLDFVPMARADQMFERKLVNCIFPASTAQMPNKERFIQSKPLKTIYAYILVKNKALLNQSLADKNIALKRGLGFGNIRNRIFANYVELNTDELVLKMLKRERVDAIVAYLPDLIAAQHKIGKDTFLTTTKSSLSTKRMKLWYVIKMRRMKSTLPTPTR